MQETLRRSYVVQENLENEVGTRKVICSFFFLSSFLNRLSPNQVFEDERIAIWEMHLKPGEDSGLHTHAYDYVYHVRSDNAKLDLFDENNTFLGCYEMVKDDCMSWKLEGDQLTRVDEQGQVHSVPACHKAVNVGTTTFVETLVEHKLPLSKQ
jgi:hypothetical protein